MNDVAKMAGVSRQLVSLVLRDLPGASAATRTRILEAAETLGYAAESHARSPRATAEKRVGVVFSMHHAFQIDLVESLLTAARGQGYKLVLGPLTTDFPHQVAVRDLVEGHVDAIIILGTDHDMATVADVQDEVPLLTVGGPTSPRAIDDVRVDDEESMRKAVEYLVRLGHTRISHVSGGSGPNAETRRSAYLDAMQQAGLSEYSDVVEAAFTEDAGSAAAEILRRRPTLPTAVIAGNDRAAVGILATLVRHGVRVPDDVSLVGFDDSTAARLSYIQLTTMHHDPEHLAVKAMETLQRRFEHPDAEPVREVVRPRLVIRHTTGEPRTRA